MVLELVAVATFSRWNGGVSDSLPVSGAVIGRYGPHRRDIGDSS